MAVDNSQEVKVNIVGASTFGRYPKISLEKTYNMYTSDEWLVNYPGFKKVVDFGRPAITPGVGRALFNSTRGNFLIAVVGAQVYRLQANLVPNLIGSLESTIGHVSIDENLNEQICIVDGQKAYIYNYNQPLPVLTPQNLVFVAPGISFPIYPNYVCYHNTFFLFGSSPNFDNSQFWYAFEFDPTAINTIKLNSQFSIQTKPDSALVVKRLPGRGNNVLVIGSIVAEVWTQVGGSENYRRVQSFNIDSGLVASSTVAESEDFLCWLSQNQNNSPSIVFTNGAEVQRISTDGIDHLMDQLQFPEQSTAFFYRQDGHLFYQITFFNPVDNLTLMYDFTDKKFSHASDEKLDFHPARTIVYFNKSTYFISIDNAGLFKMDSLLLTYDYSLDPDSIGEDIPRIRICKTIRMENAGRFRAARFTFTIEQGVNDYYVGNPIIPRVDMSFSKNGNQSFSNIVSRNLNPSGHYQNQISWHRMGQANEFTIQLRFWGMSRLVVNNGFLDVVVE